MEQNEPIDEHQEPAGRVPGGHGRVHDRDHDRARDAALVGRTRDGDPRAFGELYDVWFDRVHDVARRIVRDPHTAAEVTQDAFLSAWRSLDSLTDPASFGGWLLRIARNAALNRVGREARASAVDAAGLAVIEEQGASPVSAPAGFGVEDRAAALADPARVAGDRELVALVHEAAGALSERDAEVLHLQLRHQLTPAEVGEVLEVNRNAANQVCHRARERFGRAFAARLLWRDGSPRCAGLRTELAERGATVFDADTVRKTTSHVERCAACAEERRTRLAPSALFGAVGVVPALVTTKTSVAHALAAQGVSMDGSAALGGPGPGPGGSATGPSTDPALVAVRETPEGAISPPPGGATRQVVIGLAVAAVLVVVAVAAFLVERRPEGSGGPVRALAAPPGSTVPGSAAAGRRPDGSGPAPGADAPGAAGSAATPSVPTGPTGTRADGSPATPTTGRPSGPTVGPSTTGTQIVVEHFTVTPSGPQPAVWSMATGPRLSWSVTGAVEVTIWQYYDDGGSEGAQRQGIVATGSSGSVALCPGSRVDGNDDACTAPAGHYRYELVAVGTNGSDTVTGRPGFDVLAPVIR